MVSQSHLEVREPERMFVPRIQFSLEKRMVPVNDRKLVSS